MLTKLRNERMALAFAIALPLIVLVGFIKPNALTSAEEITKLRFWINKANSFHEDTLY